MRANSTTYLGGVEPLCVAGRLGGGGRRGELLHLFQPVLELKANREQRQAFKANRGAKAGKLLVVEGKLLVEGKQTFFSFEYSVSQAACTVMEPC